MIRRDRCGYKIEVFDTDELSPAAWRSWCYDNSVGHHIAVGETVTIVDNTWIYAYTFPVKAWHPSRRDKPCKPGTWAYDLEGHAKVRAYLLRTRPEAYQHLNDPAFPLAGPPA